MAAITRLSIDGYGARRAGSFSGKVVNMAQDVLISSVLLLSPMPRTVELIGMPKGITHIAAGG